MAAPKQSRPTERGTTSQTGRTGTTQRTTTKTPAPAPAAPRRGTQPRPAK